MNRYILIDNASGFVWGEANASSPEEACRAVDADLGTESRTYFEVSRLASNQTGYLVHEASGRFPEVEDGQDLETIMSVQSLPLVATFLVVDGSWGES